MRHSLPRSTAAPNTRMLAALLLTGAVLALLALLPTAIARAGTPTITAPPTAEVESVLGQTPVGSISPEELAAALSELEGLEGLQGAHPADLREALTKLVEELGVKGATLEELLGGGEATSILKAKLTEVLGPLASKLEELLGGNTQQKLTEALESTDASELIEKLLGGSTEPQTLIAQILAALGPERLQSLLGSVLGGEPFSKETVEGLAAQLGTTPAALAAQLGKTAEQLPPTAMALTAPLTDGETLGVLGGAGGLTLGLIKGAGETVGATGGSGASGGSGAPGGSGGSGTGTTVMIPTPGTTPATGTAAAAKKLRVISHKVKGTTATIVVEVPSAGKLSAGAKGVRSISRETAKSERVTLHPALTKADTTAVRKHHRRVKVPLKVSFKQTGGPSSSATVQLTYP